MVQQIYQLFRWASDHLLFPPCFGRLIRYVMITVATNRNSANTLEVERWLEVWVHSVIQVESKINL